MTQRTLDELDNHYKIQMNKESFEKHGYARRDFLRAGAVSAIATLLGGRLASLGFAVSSNQQSLDPTRRYLVPQLDSSGQPASYIVCSDTDGTIMAIDPTTGAADYSGSDVATVVQNAIDSLSASGGKILLKAGTYPAMSTIYLRDGITLEGEGTGDVPQGRTPTTIQYNGTGHALSCVGERGQAPKGMILRGIYIKGNPGSMDGLNSDNFAHFNIQNCVFGSHRNGIWLANTPVLGSIERCEFRDNRIKGISLSGPESVTIVGCLIKAAGQDGVSIDNGYSTSIIGCTVNANVRYGITVYSAAGIGSRGITILNNHLETNGGHQVRVNGTASIKSRSINIIGNDILSNAPSCCGISVANSDSISIIGNCIQRSGAGPFQIEDSASNVKLVNNSDYTSTNGTTVFSQDVGTAVIVQQSLERLMQAIA